VLCFFVIFLLSLGQLRYTDILHQMNMSFPAKFVVYKHSQFRYSCDAEFAFID